MWPDVFLQCFVFPFVPGSIHMVVFGCCCTYVPAGHDMGGRLNSFPPVLGQAGSTGSSASLLKGTAPAHGNLKYFYLIFVCIFSFKHVPL